MALLTRVRRLRIECDHRLRQSALFLPIVVPFRARADAGRAREPGHPGRITQFCCGELGADANGVVHRRAWGHAQPLSVDRRLTRGAPAAASASLRQHL
jgi:hypothetical protein